MLRKNWVVRCPVSGVYDFLETITQKLLANSYTANEVLVLFPTTINPKA